MNHDVKPRSRDLDEPFDAKRTHRCSACQAVGGFDDDKWETPCPAAPLFPSAA